MSTQTNPIGAIIGKLFPKSEKAISEKLATEEFNNFASDAEELQNRLDAQASGNTAEQTDRLTAQTQVTDLTAQLATANASVLDLQTQITTLTDGKTTAETNAADLQTKLTASEEYVTRLKASINPLGDEDESNKSGAADASEALTDTDMEARKAYKR